MKMMVKKVGQPVELVDLPNKYDTLKDAVGGWIECVRLEKGVILWCNEEGKLLNLPHNFTINNISIEGDVIFTGDDYKGGNVSLKQKQIEYVIDLLTKRETEYQKWIDRFFEEKDLPLEVWTFTRGSCISNIDNRTVVAYLRNEQDPDAQKKIHKILAVMDFKDCDINHFLNYCAGGIFEAQMIGAKVRFS